MCAKVQCVVLVLLLEFGLVSSHDSPNQKQSNQICVDVQTGESKPCVFNTNDDDDKQKSTQSTPTPTKSLSKANFKANHNANHRPNNNNKNKSNQSIKPTCTTHDRVGNFYITDADKKYLFCTDSANTSSTIHKLPVYSKDIDDHNQQTTTNEQGFNSTHSSHMENLSCQWRAFTCESTNSKTLIFFAQSSGPGLGAKFLTCAAKKHDGKLLEQFHDNICQKIPLLAALEQDIGQFFQAVKTDNTDSTNNNHANPWQGKRLKLKVNNQQQNHFLNFNGTHFVSDAQGFDFRLCLWGQPNEWDNC